MPQIGQRAGDKTIPAQARAFGGLPETPYQAQWIIRASLRRWFPALQHTMCGLS